jgi:hypothetical protein
VYSVFTFFPFCAKISNPKNNSVLKHTLNKKYPPKPTSSRKNVLILLDYARWLEKSQQEKLHTI